MANFFIGGDPSASVYMDSPFSILRFIPEVGERGEGVLLTRVDNELDSLPLGGVDRAEGASGVPDRLCPSTSWRRRAARLLVDVMASAWQVAWNTYGSINMSLDPRHEYSRKHTLSSLRIAFFHTQSSSSSKNSDLIDSLQMGQDIGLASSPGGTIM